MNRTNSRSFYMNSRITRDGITTVVARAYPANGGAAVSTSMQVTVNPNQPTTPAHVNSVSLTAPQTVGTNTDTIFRFTANPNFDASRMVIEFWSGSELRWSSAMNRTNSRSFFMNSRMTRNGVTTVVVRAYPANGEAAVSASMQVTVNPR